jgi:hypothetical protein
MPRRRSWTLSIGETAQKDKLKPREPATNSFGRNTGIRTVANEQKLEVRFAAQVDASLRFKLFSCGSARYRA